MNETNHNKSVSGSSSNLKGKKTKKKTKRPSYKAYDLEMWERRIEEAENKTKGSSKAKLKRLTHKPVVVTELNEYDVLLGRGSGIARHPGNQNFRCLVWDYKEEYYAAPNQDKYTVGLKVLKEIEAKGGRVWEVLEGDLTALDKTNGSSSFARCKDNKKTFATVSKARALEKTCQALREKKAKNIPEGYAEYYEQKYGTPLSKKPILGEPIPTEQPRKRPIFSDDEDPEFEAMLGREPSAEDKALAASLVREIKAAAQELKDQREQAKTSRSMTKKARKKKRASSSSSADDSNCSSKKPKKNPSPRRRSATSKNNRKAPPPTIQHNLNDLLFRGTGKAGALAKAQEDATIVSQKELRDLVMRSVPTTPGPTTLLSAFSSGLFSSAPTTHGALCGGNTDQGNVPTTDILEEDVPGEEDRKPPASWSRPRGKTLKALSKHALDPLHHSFPNVAQRKSTMKEKNRSNAAFRNKIEQMEDTDKDVPCSYDATPTPELKAFTTGTFFGDAGPPTSLGRARSSVTLTKPKTKNNNDNHNTSNKLTKTPPGKTPPAVVSPNFAKKEVDVMEEPEIVAALNNNSKKKSRGLVAAGAPPCLAPKVSRQFSSFSMELSEIGIEPPSLNSKHSLLYVGNDEDGDGATGTMGRTLPPPSLKATPSLLLDQDDDDDIHDPYHCHIVAQSLGLSAVTDHHSPYHVGGRHPTVAPVALDDNDVEEEEEDDIQKEDDRLSSNESLSPIAFLVGNDDDHAGISSFRMPDSLPDFAL